MARVSLRNSPLLAALLGTVVTGLGHLYLRRWRRAVGWLGVAVGASVLFVPPSTVSAFGSGTGDLLAVLPVVLITGASALDAYLIARFGNRPDGRPDGAAEATDADDSPACPACGKPVDPDLAFCHWCSTEFEGAGVTESRRSGDNQAN